MYAVIQTGGKQYRVAEGETLRVEKLVAAAGDKLSFDSLLFADDGGNVRVGQPLVSGVKWPSAPWPPRGWRWWSRPWPRRWRW